MNSKLLLVVVLSIIFAGSLDAAVLGVPYTVTGNVDTSLDFGVIPGTGPTLNIKVDSTSQITLSLYVSVSANLPGGFQAMSFGANVGYTFAISGGNLIYATLTTPSLSLGSYTNITGSVTAGCLRFDAGLQQYTQVDIASYSQSNHKIEVSLPQVGTYLFVAYTIGIPVPTLYNETRKIAANVQTTLNYGQQFFLQVTTSASANITVSTSSSNPESNSDQGNSFQSEGKVSLDAYWEIEMEGQATVDAVLKYQYDNAVLTAKGVAADTLAFGYYTADGWQFDGGASVDSSAQVVSQPTKHFSTWGVFAGNSAMSSNPSCLLIVSVALVVISLFF